MNYCKPLYLMLGITSAWVPMAKADCSLPCGPQEILECAAAAQNISLSSGEELYNTVLFNKSSSSPTLDGLCQLPIADLPSGTLTSNLQKIYYYPPTGGPVTGQGYCLNSNPSYPYFSYQAFISAAALLASIPQPLGGLACTGTIKDRYIELASLLATYAQETSGGNVDEQGKCIPPCNGGFFYRYENSALQSGNDLNYATVYYKNTREKFIVAASQTAGSNILTQKTYTPVIWYADNPSPSAAGGQKLSLSSTPLAITFYFDSTQTEINNTAPIDNRNAIPLTDPSVLYPGLWVGIGPTQLTAESLYYFYGWYENVFHDLPTSNYYAFVNQYFTDGQLGFIGAFWYWMYRKNGSNYQTLHQIMTNTDPTKQVCHGIGAATKIVNGGCNNFAGRKSYYDYFAGILDPNGAIGIQEPYTYGTYNSMDCDSLDDGYCQLTT